MGMVQKSFYIETQVYQQLARLARQQKMPAARLMRSLIRVGLQSAEEQQNQGTKFLLKLTGYKLRGGPKDLAQNHDKYTWE